MIALHRDSKDRHRQKIRENDHYNDLEERKVSDKARERFRRPPYQVMDVTGYMAKKYDIKRVLDQMGQLIGKVRKVEKYHENRVYILRLQEGEDADG